MDEVVGIVSVKSDVPDHNNRMMMTSMMTGSSCSTSPSSFEADDDLSSTSNHSHPLSSTQLSVNDRLNLLESSIKNLSLDFQNHFQSVKPTDQSHGTTIKPILNQDAIPFVPSSASNQHSTSHQKHAQHDFNLLSQSEQIQSLSSQVHLLSNTMSQLLSTLITSPHQTTLPTTTSTTTPTLTQSIQPPPLKLQPHPNPPSILSPTTLNPPYQPTPHRSFSINSSQPSQPLQPPPPRHLNFNSPPAPSDYQHRIAPPIISNIPINYDAAAAAAAAHHHHHHQPPRSATATSTPGLPSQLLISPPHPQSLTPHRSRSLNNHQLPPLHPQPSPSLPISPLSPIVSQNPLV